MAAPGILFPRRELNRVVVLWSGLVFKGPESPSGICVGFSWLRVLRLAGPARHFAFTGMLTRSLVTVACTAIARELVDFIWAVALEVQPA
jgi:hypothetical protein